MNNKILLSFIYFLLVSFFHSQSFAIQTDYSNLPLVDVTFKYAGPNCFGSALFGSGIYQNIRGVDVGEFSHILESSCSEVEEPQKGDIGVFIVSNFAPIHAFMYLDKDTAYEKQGVDYVGATPIQLIGLDSLIYRAEADPLCRRHGDETCFNKLKYYRCGEYQKPQALIDYERELELVIRGLLYLPESDLRQGLDYLRTIKSIDASIIDSLEQQLYFIFGEVEQSPLLTT